MDIKRLTQSHEKNKTKPTKQKNTPCLFVEFDAVVTPFKCNSN